MDGMTFLGFILIVVVGFSLLALTLELLNPARQSAAQKAEKHVSEGVRAAESMVATMPAFFAKPQTDQLPLATPGFDEALLAMLQNHVKTERAMAREFVYVPSIDSLYREPTVAHHALTAAAGFRRADAPV
jgi:hypothetical protein